MNNPYFSKMYFYIASAVLVFAALLCSQDVQACSVPVFRYALERWRADAYQVEVPGAAELDDEAKSAVEMLDEYAGGVEGPVNLRIIYKDEANEPNIRQQLQMTVYYPFDRDKEGAVWSAPLTKEAVKKLVDSPVRKEIAGRILQGDWAVWVLLECGDRQKDDAAAALLEKQLEVMEDTVQLPEAAIAEGASEPNAAFSMIRLSRADVQEQFLVACLLGIEADLKDFNEPMAWPVFGRGRALLPLVGKGITKENIAYGCRFLCGPCACTIKVQNPGFDLLLAANWDELIEPMYVEQEYVQELTGVFEVSAETNEPTVNITLPVVETELEGPGGKSNLVGVVLLVLAGITAFIIVGSFIVVRR